jgi:hypothetical protein
MKILIGALLIYACYYLLLFFMQRTIIFPRGSVGMLSGNTPEIPGMEKIWVTTGSGSVESWYLPPAEKSQAPAPLVVFGHGNGEVIDFWPHDLERFNELGMGLFLVEYPGYGRSQGKPSQKSITEAFVAAYDTILKREAVDSTRIVFWRRGHTLQVGLRALPVLAQRTNGDLRRRPQ